MPGLNTQLMLATARARFARFQLRLPPAAAPQAPLANMPAAIRSGAPPQTAFTRPQAARGLPLPCPPALFLAASGDAPDIEVQRARSSAMDAYLTRVCDAVGQAHAAWRAQARLAQVIVNAAQALGGTLLSAPLEPEIRARAPREEQWQRSRSDAIAAGIGSCWENWQRSVSVPGLPWYPSFVAFPGPMAPPTPNIPMPLVALTQSPIHLNGSQLKAQMLLRYSGDNEWPGELFESVAAGLEAAFQLWAPSQMVTNVMGTGTVPTFAPPYVPVGPVVGGTASQLPGAWLA